MSEDTELVLDTDSTIPIDDVFLTAQEAIIRHGGIATQLVYNKLEEMDLDTFIKEEVPVLKKSQEIHFIRDDYSRSFTIVNKNQVLKLSCDKITELPLKFLVSQLKDKDANKVEFVCCLPYQLLTYSVDSMGNKIVVVRVPERRTMYKTCITLRHGKPDLSLTLYFPPLVFAFCLTSTNAVTRESVWVAPDMSIRPDDIKLCRWPFSNVFSDGSICLGDTRANTSLQDAPTMQAAVTNAVELFYTSTYNTDLIYEDYVRQLMEEPYIQDVAIPPEYEDLYKHTSSGTQRYIRFLLQFTDPAAWKFFNYQVVTRGVLKVGNIHERNSI